MRWKIIAAGAALAAVLAAGAMVAAFDSAVPGWESTEPPPPTAAPKPAPTPTPALPLGSCGTALTHRLNSETIALSASPGASLTCFQKAARTCTPASIRVTEMGVDAGTWYVFAIGPERCEVTQSRQDYGISRTPFPIVSAACRLVAVTGRGVTLDCLGQDLLIPAAVTRQHPAARSAG